MCFRNVGCSTNCCRTVLNHVVAAAPRLRGVVGEEGGGAAAGAGCVAETATPRSSCGSARSASRRRPRNLRVQDLRRQASSPLAAEPSRLLLGHRPSPSRRRLPSSLGASGAGSGSSRSTSPRWRRCARGCRRGCAAPGLASGSVGLPRRQRHRRDRRWPCPSRATRGDSRAPLPRARYTHAPLRGASNAPRHVHSRALRRPHASWTACASPENRTLLGHEPTLSTRTHPPPGGAHQ